MAEPERPCDAPPPSKKARNEAGSAVKDDARVEPESKQNADNLVWVDCEMTGLDLKKHFICEIAVLVTDVNLNIIAEGPEIVIKLTDKQLCAMSAWCVNHHGDSGLTKQIQGSTITMKEAETQVLDFIKKYVPSNKAPLCGNSIHADKRFLAKDMPRVANYLHYRIIDVSTIKELCRRWYPGQFNKAPPKKMSHRALDDIKESILELKYYKSNIFVQPGKDEEVDIE